MRNPLLIALAVLMSAASPVIAAELKVTGAAALANPVVLPNKAALETAAGVSLSVIVNGDGNGMKDLAGGKSDVMMVAAPLAATAAILNKAAPGSINAGDFQMHDVGSIAIRFIVNPANPVKSLSAEQMRNILTGQITNWKEVGGGDQPILVVAEPAGFGTRTNIEASFMNGTELTGKARLVQALVQVAQVVSQAPQAIGYGNAASITPAVAVLPDLSVRQPLGYATRGPASPEVAKLIAATRGFAEAVK